jgi:hypothetical protein
MDRERLIREMEHELNQLRLLAQTAGALAELEPKDRRQWDSQAAAKMIADLAGGLENLCRRRLRALSLQEPEGPDWHRMVLEDFLTVPDLGARLTPDLAHRLRKYLAFRHRFIHGYGFQVDWRMVEEPLRLLPETVEEISKIWRDWLKSI